MREEFEDRGHGALGGFGGVDGGSVGVGLELERVSFWAGLSAPFLGAGEAHVFCWSVEEVDGEAGNNWWVWYRE